MALLLIRVGMWDDGYAKTHKSESGYDVCEQPNPLLYRSHFHFEFPRNGNDVAHYRAVTDGKDDTCAGPLCDEHQGKGKVAGLQHILGCSLDDSRDHFTEVKFFR